MAASAGRGARLQARTRSKRFHSRPQTYNAQCCASGAGHSPPVMVNDVRGKMGYAVGEAVLRRGLQLVPIGLTGHSGGGEVQVGDTTVTQYCFDECDPGAVLKEAQEKYPGMIVVDFTVPAVVEQMCELYVSQRQNFVMGTTGGDRDKLQRLPQEAGLHAVVAPQMGKQVVAFQAAMELMAQEFPNAFAGYDLTITESHQSSKADTSGTAKAMVNSFQQLGLEFSEGEIERIRDPQQSVSRMGVPEEHLSGHAFHTYDLRSSDGSVQLQFQHNVCGRAIYAEGSVDAVRFLAKQVAESSDQKVFSMIDILRSGLML